jgi:hypothetical protein
MARQWPSDLERHEQCCVVDIERSSLGQAVGLSEEAGDLLLLSASTPDGAGHQQAFVDSET